MTDPDSEADPLGAVAELFLARLRRGERPSLGEYAARHPDLAEQILELFPALVELEGAGEHAGGPVSTATAACDMRPGGQGPHPARLGDYRILRYVGAGGMGIVYEAVRESLSSHVALKVIHPRFRGDADYLGRFLVEARSAAGLHHTNIVSVFDVGEQGGVYYYAMQFIRGQGLDRVLDDVRRLRASQTRDKAPDPASELSRTVARGLVTGRFGPADTGPPGEGPGATQPFGPDEGGARRPHVRGHVGGGKWPPGCGLVGLTGRTPRGAVLRRGRPDRCPGGRRA